MSKDTIRMTPAALRELLRFSVVSGGDDGGVRKNIAGDRGVAAEIERLRSRFWELTAERNHLRAVLTSERGQYADERAALQSENEALRVQLAAVNEALVALLPTAPAKEDGE